MVTRDFAACVEAYNRLVLFTRSGQYEWHHMTIEARQRLRDQAEPIAALKDAQIDDPCLDIPAVARQAWQVIESLGIARNKSLIVFGTKALHHLLPDLMPPMDRAWTGAFFLWSAAAPQTAQAATFARTFTGLAQVASTVRPAQLTGTGWRTSTSKILDNAIIGYCKLNDITPAQTWTTAFQSLAHA
jgi:hypothetical protein